MWQSRAARGAPPDRAGAGYPVGAWVVSVMTRVGRWAWATWQVAWGAGRPRTGLVHGLVRVCTHGLRARALLMRPARLRSWRITPWQSGGPRSPLAYNALHALICHVPVSAGPSNVR
jgi:hypothetical protein